MGLIVLFCFLTYRLTADVGVPDFGPEAHGRRLEGVGIGDGDVDLEGAAGIWSVGRAVDCAHEPLEGDAVGGSSEDA